MLIVLAACHHAPGPVLYPVPQPPLLEPDRLDAHRAGDECPAPAAYLPGELPPYIRLDESGPVVTCRGLVVDDADYAELRADADLAPYWRERAQICSEGRAEDRFYAQGLHDTCWASWQETATEARRLRLAVPLAVVGGIILGSGMTLGVLRAVELTVP